MVGVRQHLEVETLFRAELFVRVDTVEAHSQNNRIVFGILGLVHLELVGFARSTRGLIFGIEVKDNPLAAVVLQADEAILRGQGEIGSHASLGGLRRT